MNPVSTVVAVSYRQNALHFERNQRLSEPQLRLSLAAGRST
jgi:hypothetical protein